MAISDEDLRGLSANEREILIAAEADDEDGDIAQELSGKRSPSAPADDELVVTTAAQDAEAAAAAALAAAPAEAPAAAPAAPAAPGAAGIEAAVEAEDDDAPTPRAAPADIADQRVALNAREDDSMQKLLDGEITQAEHAVIKNEVRASLDTLLVAEATDKATANIEYAGMMKLYNADVKVTKALGKAAGLDYSSADLTAKFDRAVVMFSNELAAQGISDKPGNLANSRKALSEAHAYMLRAAGKVPAPVVAAAAAVVPKGGRPAPDRSKLGMTLAAIPVAADAGIASEFAHLEGITNPADLERQLAKLTPEQERRYLDS